MDINELFSSCKRGDLNRIKYLVEHKEINMNIRDKWDSTPLLLETGELSDVTFVVNGSTFNVHRCILSARCIYFCDKFETRWQKRRVINIRNNLVHPSAFKSLMQYIYTGRLETHIDHVEDCKRLAVQCRLPLLKKELEDMVQKVTSFECSKPGMNVKMLILESVELAAELQQDLGVLGMQAVPQELCTWVTGVDLPLMPIVPLFLVDVCFCVSGYKFNCHKVKSVNLHFLFYICRNKSTTVGLVLNFKSTVNTEILIKIFY
ncbi:hypothetical protein C0J52_01396 [Blattella germanica]|nr:hypothetical protein C0J52_01396 [Blattella germanica]